MRPIKFKQKDVIDLFYKEKVLTKDQLFGICGFSNMTAWRILSDYGYISSYNLNAKYYTLTDIPVFDKNGLWSYHKVRFSKYGSLTNTVIGLIFNSRSGLEKNELQKLIGVNPVPILSKLYHQGKLNREKVDGLYVYFQIDKDVQCTQLSNRQTDRTKWFQERLPEPERIIAVLVELIQQVELQPRQIVQRLGRKGIKITLGEIRTIFQHYQLTKKNRWKS
jgi:hypothetical protein